MRTLLTAALVLPLTLGACTSDRAPAEDTATELADALSAGTLPADLFGGTSPQDEYDALVGPLGDTAPRVEVGEVTEGEDDTAQAELAWTWDLDGRTWDYTSTADLRFSAEEWEVSWTPSLVEPSLEDGDVLEVSAQRARRGPVLGAGGARIVVERPVVRLGLDKTQVPLRRVADSARRIATVLDLDARSFVALAEAAGAQAFVEAVVLRPADARRVPAAYDGIRGAVALDATLPLAPTREFAAPILGRVGPATAELIEESDGRLEAGDQTGLSGLQARYDEQLSGTDGLLVAAVAEDGEETVLFDEPAVDGQPLRTTLDPALQTRAERVLAGPGAPRGPAALVAVRPSDGAILAAANGPGTGGLNIATFGQAAPGSTFKVVSSLALLRAGLTPQSSVSCPTQAVVDGRAFENYDDYPAAALGRITLRQAVANSCNTVFVGAAERLGEGDLARAAESLGFGTDYDVGFPAYFGQVPPPESETGAAAAMIGQGTVLASPLAMASVAASVQAGRTVVPHLLDDVVADPAPAVPLTGGEAASLRGLMRAVVTEGSGSQLASLPGEVGAKTGTAEYGEPGPGGELPVHAWMIATRGDLAVAAYVETGVSGSSTAGPLLAAFLR